MMSPLKCFELELAFVMIFTVFCLYVSSDMLIIYHGQRRFEISTFIALCMPAY